MNSLKDLELKIDYRFNDSTLLTQALTHVSFANENHEESYERLEFLGDAVIELVVSEYIYKYYYFDSGVSSKLRASLVSTEYLSKIAKELCLEDFARKGRGLPSLSKKNVADLMESLIGAIYVDGGMMPASDVVSRFVIKDITNVDYVLNNSIDYKSQLQELLQAQGTAFEYKLKSTDGLDHEKVFHVGLFVDGVEVSESSGRSIQEAQNICASQYYKRLNI